MKTKLFLFLSGCLLMVACNNGSGGGNNQPQYTMNQFGQCVNQQGQIAPNQSMCMNNGMNGGYFLANNQCYSSNGQPVAMQLCNTNGGFNGGGWNGGFGGGYGYGGSQQQCFGTYFFQSMYGMQQVNCQGTNCRGYTLYNSSYMPVQCI